MGVHVNLELTGRLAEHLLDETGEGGTYSDVEAYIRDLIERDIEAVEAHQFRTVKEHLQAASATPEEDYVSISAEEFLQEMRSRHACSGTRLARLREAI